LYSSKATATENTLIILLKSKDEKGFTILYDSYSAALYGVVLKIVRSEEMAKDVLQDSFVKIWKHIDAYDACKGRLFTWILNIARNTAIDKTRSSEFKRTSQSYSIENKLSLINKSFNTLTQVEFIGIREQVNKLKPACQSIIDLIYFKGYTQAEVAEELHIPLGTVKTRVKTAVNQLRESLIE
jgi:RNA polymerase sigma-70 factor (ECF subfamily)